MQFFILFIHILPQDKFNSRGNAKARRSFFLYRHFPFLDGGVPFGSIISRSLQFSISSFCTYL